MSDLRTPEQTAAFLCVSQGTLANWRVTGAGPTFIKVGRKVAYRTTDVLAWLESNARQNTSQVVSREDAASTAAGYGSGLDGGEVPSVRRHIRSRLRSRASVGVGQDAPSTAPVAASSLPTAPTARQAGLSRRTPTPAVEVSAAGAEVPRG